MPTPTTRWSLIVAARGQSSSARMALAQLCENYRPVVLDYFRRHDKAQLAEDRTQEFFLHFLQRQLQDRVDAARGSLHAAPPRSQEDVEAFIKQYRRFPSSSWRLGDPLANSLVASLAHPRGKPPC